MDFLRLMCFLNPLRFAVFDFTRGQHYTQGGVSQSVRQSVRDAGTGKIIII